LGLANYVRGQWFRGKHNSDKAISAFDAAYTADDHSKR